MKLYPDHMFFTSESVTEGTRTSSASKCGFLGRVYEMQDFEPPTPETMARLRAIIDEAFGRVARR